MRVQEGEGVYRLVLKKRRFVRIIEKGAKEESG